MKMMKAACVAAAMTILLVGLGLGAAACGSSTTEDPAASTAPTTASSTSTLPPTTQSTTTTTSAHAADVVVFNDPVLENGIRAALNKPTGDITFDEAATLTELHLDIEWQSSEEMMIKDISALKHFVNLEGLELQFHAIDDIRPLAGLTHLKGLAIGGNRISDISPLAGLTKLDFLSMFNCTATDYSPLENLTSMRVLFLSWSTIADLSVLSRMKGLEELKLDNCGQVSDVTPLASLPKLMRLSLAETAVTDFSPLKDIYPNLTEKDFELD
jgi:Leucine-rich repeat (LRR) protein